MERSAQRDPLSGLLEPARDDRWSPRVGPVGVSPLGAFVLTPFAITLLFRALVPMASSTSLAWVLPVPYVVAGAVAAVLAARGRRFWKTAGAIVASGALWAAFLHWLVSGLGRFG